MKHFSTSKRQSNRHLCGTPMREGDVLAFRKEDVTCPECARLMQDLDEFDPKAKSIAVQYTPY